MNIGQWIHFSVDDVIECFHWIYKNEPESVFEEPMLGKLKEWHEKYKLHCDLYVFEKCEGFSLECLQDLYWEEIGMESRWLKLVWHAPDAGTDMANMKAGTDGEKEAVASLERTYKLITEKAGADSWGGVARLHLWSATRGILDSLNGKGINALLTSDRDIVSYHLGGEELESLKLLGSIWLKPFYYCTTDIRLDLLDEGVSVEGFLEKTELCFKKYLWKQRLEVFFHEWKFNRIVSGIDVYMEQFAEVRVALVTNAGVMVGKTLYFTTWNTTGLFTMDMESERIELFAALPCESNVTNKYASLCHYNGTIWMIPWHEKKILSIELKSKKIEEYPIPFPGINREEEKFRKAVQDGQYLWLLPYYMETNDMPSIVRIDMQHRFVTLYTHRLPNIKYSKNENFNFQMITRNERKLYLIRREADCGVVLDMDTGKMEEWGRNLPPGFGIFIEGNKYMASPVQEKDPVRIFDIETGEKEEFFLPEWIWGKYEEWAGMGEIYKFWYSQQIGDIVYIFPFGAKAVLLYDIKRKEMELVELKAGDYNALMPHYSIAVYDVYHLNEEQYFLPHSADVLVKVGKDKIAENIRLAVTVSKFESSMGGLPGIYEHENEQNTLENYLSRLANWEQVEWNGVETHGIHKDHGMSKWPVGSRIYQEIANNL